MKLRFKTKPWEHQRKALKYLMKRDAAALYTDMGTGKTKVMIDLIQNRGFKRVLVVTTNKACEVWEQQISIHGVDGLFSVFRLNKLSSVKVVELLKTIPKWTTTRSQDETYVFIINYEKVWRKGVSRMFMRKTLGIDCVICDESHRIKSPRSNCSKYLAKLGKLVQHRYLVTGSPLAENPIDVYAQYRFLDQEIFGTNFTAFKNEYENVDVDLSTKMGFRILDKNEPYKNLDKLREKMYSCAFYVESSVQLPPQNDIDWYFTMPVKSEKLYHEVLKEKVAELNGRYMESSNALTIVLRLQQMTSGYLKVEDFETKEKSIINIDHARREEFLELVEQFPENEPLVVFAAYTKDLKNIRLMCKKSGISYSELSGRKDTLDDWKAGKTRVIGVQYSSGSESIDLTRARYCIYYSLPRRLALYDQSRKRIHRPGQERPVYYYHMMAKLRRGKSIDEKMVESLHAKKKIVDYVMKEGWE